MGGKVLRLKIDDVYDEVREKVTKEVREKVAEEEREKGEKKGREEGAAIKELQNIERLMKSTGWSAQKAIDALGVKKEKQADYLKELS